jgi:glycine/D-amino acid oxidase-like deaminating enzyme
LSAITVDYDWWGWVCLTADLLPHVHHAADDPTVRYAIGYQGSGVSYALSAGKLLAARIAGVVEEQTIPATSTPLPRFRFASFAPHRPARDVSLVSATSTIVRERYA